MLCWVCGKCENCANDLESYCPGMITTYVATYHDGTPSYGGYSNEMIASEHFIAHFPEKLPLAGGAPLLRAGITMYSPMRYYGLDKPGTHLGIVELGGLGHVAVKFAKAFGMKVTVISTFPSKKEEAINQLGAVAFLVSRDAEQMKSSNGTFDGIIDTVAAVHPILPLIHLLKNHGKLILVGTSDKPLELPVFPLLMGRKTVASSGAGDLKETQEMIDFAAENIITADVEVIPMVNTAMERLHKGDMRY